MFNHLEGKITDLSPDSAVISCGGIGFELAITPNTASALKLGETGKLYVCESIGENNFDLYGFMSEREKKFYKLLTGVSGIGPKAAMSILSKNTPEGLTISIINSDEKALTACPGIGKKTAQRIILELKDKIAKQTETLDFSGSSQVYAPVSNSAFDEAVSGLAVLGYSAGEVMAVMKNINTEGMSSGEIIKSVLKFMV